MIIVSGFERLRAGGTPAVQELSRVVADDCVDERLQLRCGEGVVFD
jgi:hypothetical protein